MKDQLINAGIKNLKEFGYPDVNKENILTDLIYSQFFKRMLEETKEQYKNNSLLVKYCNELLSEIV
jgi:hypothetical protein